MKNRKFYLILVSIVLAIGFGINAWSLPVYVKGSINQTIGFTETLGTGPSANNITTSSSFTAQITNGTGSAQCDLPPITIVNSNLAASGTATIALDNLSSDDGTNVTTAVKIRGLWIKNTGTTNLTVGGNVNALLIFSDATDKLILNTSGAPLLWYDPAGVTFGANKNIDITNLSGGTAGSYEVIICVST